MATIFLRGKAGTWWIKYYVAGKQVYHSLRTSSQRVALTIKRQIEGDEARGELVGPSRTPLPEFLEEFCRYLSTTRTRKSCRVDICVLRVFFGPICPALKPGSHVNRRFRVPEVEPKPAEVSKGQVAARHLEEVTTEKIESFITSRIRDQNISPKTANRYREVLHVMFNFAIRTRGFISQDRRHPNPAAAVKRRREPPHTIRYLSIENIAAQFKVLKDHPVIHALVATYIYAGLRREEALWVTQEDVDLEKRILRVVSKKIDGEFWQPKTKRNRVVPISHALADILRAYKAPCISRWFFPSPKGVRWNPDNFSQDLRALNEDRGLAWGCLDYRHTFGSHLAQKGESLYKIAELMGNSPEICRRHYAALQPEKMHDVVEFTNEKQEKDKANAEDLLRKVLARLEELAPEQAQPDLKVVNA